MDDCIMSVSLSEILGDVNGIIRKLLHWLPAGKLKNALETHVFHENFKSLKKDAEEDVCLYA